MSTHEILAVLSEHHAAIAAGDAVRVEGRRLIVHLHESVPFHMDGSFRAAVELAPDVV